MVKGKIAKLVSSKSEKNRRKAIPLLEAYLNDNPNDARAWFDLACCFDFLGEELKAEPCYQKTLDLGVEKLPKAMRPGFFVGYGSTLRNNDKLNQSEHVLRRGLGMFPESAALKVFLAFTLHSQARYKEASEWLFSVAASLKGKPLGGYERAIKWYAEHL